MTYDMTALQTFNDIKEFWSGEVIYEAILL